MPTTDRPQPTAGIPEPWMLRVERAAERFASVNPTVGTRQPRGGEGDTEEGAPTEPLPEDNAPALRRPAPRQPRDVYAAVGITPEMVKRWKPRWSLWRCRRWLLRHEGALQESLSQGIAEMTHEYLRAHAGPRLIRDRNRSVERGVSLSPQEGIVPGGITAAAADTMSAIIQQDYVPPRPQPGNVYWTNAAGTVGGEMR